ncbi:hypothetical protein BDQ17DRAFT_1348910 [Cyathus striatus]|nr:hypothetical protein BDQ17DRAFT_1348910 [Cyathus striatus]
MAFIPRCLPILNHHRRHLSNLSHQTDQYGLPLRPTWSVNELLSSYPSPEISPQTLKRLHELSALIPPQEDSLEHARITREIQELVRLIEAVKLVDTHHIHVISRFEQEDADRRRKFKPSESQEDGRKLLKHAVRTMDGFYAVDAQKKQ